MIATLVARRWRNGITALVLAATSGFWLVANKPVEGPVLLPLDRYHGLTFADLFGFVGLYFALRIIVQPVDPDDSHRHPPREYVQAAVAVALFIASPLVGLFR